MSVHGTEDVLRRLEFYENAYIQRLAIALEFAGDMLVNYIKTEYDRPKTGKGFTDQTGNLRNSISRSKAVVDGDSVTVWVYAGMEYAVIVELEHGRIYAYMLPALNDKRGEILGIIQTALRKVA
jgi:hypothetical protein